MITFRQINPWALQENPSILDMVWFRDSNIPSYSTEAVWLGDSGDMMPCYCSVDGVKEIQFGPYQL